MSTHGIYNFTDESGSFAAFRHHDSYPEGAAIALIRCFYVAWSLPRFEADELAAAFVAANKTCAGGVRLVNTPIANDDQEYVYNVFQAKNGQMIVKAFKDGTEFYYGRLKDFCLKYAPDRSNDIVKVFHGEIDTAVENKKAEIRKVVKAALDALDKMKDEIEDIAVSVGE